MPSLDVDLDGAIDLHVHTAPDVYDRLLSDDEQVSQALGAGLRAVLLKSHHTLTADRATLASQRHGAQAFGGLALNHSVGGLNPVAVETAIAFGARQIWMPTIHAAHCLKTAPQEMFRAEARKGREGLTVLQAPDRLRPEALAILELIRDGEIALGTGHLAPEEALVLLKSARDMGVRRMVVTHPQMSFTRYTLPQMREAVELGAMLEFDYLSCCPGWTESVPVEEAGAAIRSVGAERCILATDGGQPNNPAPVEMLRTFARELREFGLRREEIRRMLCENPAWILGIEG
ncbi:MAG: histidinol phosphatase [Phycisphaeraceae bacterium]|nr:MAG: histidinol phosphatase [Phycisphaeraceae bacterium]